MHKTQLTKPELLAPAGNLETALAAYDAGADAVYGGLAKFNARERAANFSATDLARLLDYAHGRGRKFYLTFNTLLKESELGEAAAFLAELVKLRPDALIVQDPGVIGLVRRYFPSLTLHASTQMGIHNSAGVAAAAQLGIARVILERQVTLEELAVIAKRSRIELEVFVHGSLCCSLSGQCLLSSALGGWSGNRGKCKQPCRRAYQAAGRAGFLLSPRDLDASVLVPEFKRLGIASLKIEGRLRSPDYVWKTVRAYRLLLDGPDEPPPELMAEAERLLRSTASRRSSLGFYSASGMKQLIDSERLGVFGNVVGRVEKVARAGISVHTLDRLHLGDRLRLVPPDGGEGSAFSLIAMEFQHRPAVKVRADSNCFIPGDFVATPGFLLYKIGENGFDFSRQAAALPAGRHPVTVRLRLSATGWEGAIAELPGELWRRETGFAPAERKPFDRETAAAEFAAAVPEPWAAGEVDVTIDGDFFVPASVLKSLRREFWSWAAERLKPDELFSSGAEALSRLWFDWRALPEDRPEALPEAPELAIAPFIAEGRLDSWRGRIAAAYATGIRRFRVGALHGFDLLRSYRDIEIVSEFPLPAANSAAVQLLRSLGCRQIEPSVELDRAALEEFERKSPLPFELRRKPVPLLVTRAGIGAAGVWNDDRGNRFRLEGPDADGVTRLYPAEIPADAPSGVPSAILPFYLNEWK